MVLSLSGPLRRELQSYVELGHPQKSSAVKTVSVFKCLFSASLLELQSTCGRN